MKNIFASKLYLSSTRKTRIMAAIKDPNNLELVQQVAEYLDDEFIDPKYLDPNHSDSKSSTDNSSVQDVDHIEDNSEDTFSRSSRMPSSGFSSKGFDAMDDMFDDNSYSGEATSDESSVEESTPSDDENNVPLESSKSIKASVVLDVVKGTLNSRQDTSGVERVVEKDNELWIYYNDSINLNKVMSDATQELMIQGYSMLEFNRLARSNNAIVFDIVKTSSSGGA